MFGMAGFPSDFAMHAARPFMRNSVVTPHIAARNTDVQNDLRFRRHTQLQNGLPITFGHIRHSPIQRHWTFLRARTKVPQHVRHCNVWFTKRCARSRESLKLRRIMVTSQDAERSPMATTVTPRTMRRWLPDRRKSQVACCDDGEICFTQITRPIFELTAGTEGFSSVTRVAVSSRRWFRIR